MSLEVLHCGHLCCRQSPLIRPSLWYQSEERHFLIKYTALLWQEARARAYVCRDRDGAKDPSEQGEQKGVVSATGR